MPRLGNSLVYDLLDVADELARLAGRGDLRKAAQRRAVSTAYYAVFHALCFICADELVRWSRSDDLDPIYRSVEHGFARKALAGPRAAAIGQPVLSIGAAFTDLQKRRHAADYMPPGLQVAAGWAAETIELAKQTISAIEQLGEVERRRIAILSIARPKAD